MHTVYLSLGTNLGNKEQNLLSAIHEISMRIGSVTAQSAFIETEPWGFDSKNSFLNAVVRVETTMHAEDILKSTQLIERHLGRTQKSSHDKNGQVTYHDRTIDIDILLYDNMCINTPNLTVPHPHMQERDFVMIPLSQILPDAEDFLEKLTNIQTNN